MSNTTRAFEKTAHFYSRYAARPTGKSWFSNLAVTQSVVRTLIAERERPCLPLAEAPTTPIIILRANMVRSPRTTYISSSWVHEEFGVIRPEAWGLLALNLV